MKSEVTSQESARTSLPIRLLNWTLGAASLLNLIQDAGLISIAAKLKIWIDSYSIIVRFVAKILFGWLAFGWLNINENEMHVLILAVILCTAATSALRIELSDINPTLPEGRMSLRQTKLAYWALKWGLSMPAFTRLFALVLLPALIIPDEYGLYGSIVGFLYLMASTLIVTVPGSIADPTIVRREAVGVLAAFLIMVVLNHLLLQRHDA